MWEGKQGRLLRVGACPCSCWSLVNNASGSLSHGARQVLCVCFHVGGLVHALCLLASLATVDDAFIVVSCGTCVSYIT